MAFFELVNAILYILAFLIYWKRKKKIDAYFVLLLSYTITAITCFLYQNSGFSIYYNTTLYSYVYLFICIMLLLQPFKKLEVENQLNIKETWAIKGLVCIYLVTGIISIYYTLPKTLILFQTDDWNSVRQALYSGDKIELYGSQLERICKNIHSYLNSFGIVMCFYELAKPKKNKYLLALLFGTWLVQSFLSATLVASRGIVATLILNVGLILIIFKNTISTKARRYFLIILFILLIPSIYYMISVSVSRFGDTEAKDSIFQYLGHAMQCFNERIMGSMHDFTYGKYAFNYFFTSFGLNSEINMLSLGNTSNTGFYTIVGDFYIDLGPIFTIIFCFIFGRFLFHFTKKQKKTLSDLIVIVYFASFLMNGIFVIGRGYFLQWVMLCVVYWIVRISENARKKQIYN